MKKTLKMMVFTVLAFGLFACGGNGRKLTVEDMRDAQATLFNADGTLNEKKAPKVAKKYCRYVEQNPNDTASVKWLFHAMEINVMLKDADKSVELCDQLLQQYPQSKWAPMSLILLGSYVYEDMLNDTAQAHAAYQKLIDEYPESHLVDDAQKCIEYLGLSDDDRISKAIMSQMEVVEDEDEDLEEEDL